MYAHPVGADTGTGIDTRLRTAFATAFALDHRMSLVSCEARNAVPRLCDHGMMEHAAQFGCGRRERRTASQSGNSGTSQTARGDGPVRWTTRVEPRGRWPHRHTERECVGSERLPVFRCVTRVGYGDWRDRWTQLHMRTDTAHARGEGGSSRKARAEGRGGLVCALSSLLCGTGAVSMKMNHAMRHKLTIVKCVVIPCGVVYRQ